jgi:hypothetical protein
MVDCGRGRCDMHDRDITLWEMREAMAGGLIDPSSFIPC